MADSPLTKKPSLEKSSGESKSGCKKREFRKYDPYDDEYIRQYVLYYYQFHKSEGFEIDWDSLHYLFDTIPVVDELPLSESMTNDYVVRQVACLAIVQYNAINGTRIVYLNYVSASFKQCGGTCFWITFSGLDLASSNREPKLYQTKILQSGTTCLDISIFRLRPTDEDIAAVQVDPPPPLYDDDPEFPTILFTVTGPGYGYMSVPVVEFTRIPAEVEPAYSCVSIVADTPLTKNLWSSKKPRLEKSYGESKSACKQREFRKYDPYDDEYIRQYVLYYYQFHKSEGFEIDWDSLDYLFDTIPVVEELPLSQSMTNDDVVCQVACLTIVQYNAVKGTRIVFLDHVSASFMQCGGKCYWITFWGTDLASSSLEPKLYQTKVLLSGTISLDIYIFRLRPTDEDIAAVQVDPPPPLYDDDPEFPTILFTVTGPGSGGYMAVPVVEFTRIPAEVEHVYSP